VYVRFGAEEHVITPPGLLHEARVSGLCCVRGGVRTAGHAPELLAVPSGIGPWTLRRHGPHVVERQPLGPTGLVPGPLAALPRKRTINVTDPDTRVIARETRQPLQGYNAHAIATSEQIIVAADITQQSSDSGQLEPMIHQAVETLAAAGCREQVGTVLADGGYWNNAHITTLGEAGVQVIIPTRSVSRTKARKLSPRNRGQRPNGSTGCRTRPTGPRSTGAANT